MPKPISKSIPSSSVAKLFDLSAAAKALQPQDNTETKQASLSAERRTQASSDTALDLSSETTMAGSVNVTADQTHNTVDQARSRVEQSARESVRQSARVNGMNTHTSTRTEAVPRQRVVYPEFIPSTSREFMLTPKADAVIEHLVDVFRRTTRTRLTTSHVARAVIKAIDHAMEEIERAAKTLPALKLPPNSRGGELERERFEAVLADVIVSSLRASSAFRDDEP